MCEINVEETRDEGNITGDVHHSSADITWVHRLAAEEAEARSGCKQQRDNASFESAAHRIS